MSDNRHNISPMDGGDFPFADDASSTDLARVLATLGALAPELEAPLVTEELRLAQYLRARSIARWLIGATDSLIEGLEGEINRQKGQS